MKRYAMAGLLGIGLLSCLLQPTSRPLRAQLLNLRKTYSLAAIRAQDNLKNQFTPGYKARVQWGGEGGLNWSQGEIFKTQTATNLAVNGVGCFGLTQEISNKNIAYTRDGRFAFQQGVLQTTDGWNVLGMPLDTLGNICGEQGPIRLSCDPQTCLYEGRYTGFRFDETGKLFGESSMTDPVTGQQATTMTPLYQVLLFGFPNPAGLADQPGPNHNLWSATEASGLPYCGVPGQGALGALCPGSLELSNVDFMQEGKTLQWVVRHCQALAQDNPTSPIQQELLGKLRSHARLRQAAVDNLSHSLTPGYRCWDLLGYLETGRLELRTGQARMLETKNPTDLALDGPAYFLLSSGEITRNGRLLWSEKGLAVGDSQSLLMGFAGEKLEPVRIPAQAANWEVSARGEVRWTELDGKTTTGYRLALVRPTGSLSRSGENLRARFSHETSGTYVAQGYLEPANEDHLEEEISGGALLELAGLPPFYPHDLRQKDAGQSPMPKFAF
ncbi:hypothetical protein ABS71_21835 [bacterium SCN 62-11]|nr:hypothetical protein [Candidatus Eremiobacteraeota bacterium]ODT56442.1 MAG: hypothetical protein ABS71_21835 [bacterium SCN 62-11]